MLDQRRLPAALLCLKGWHGKCFIAGWGFSLHPRHHRPSCPDRAVGQDFTVNARLFLSRQRKPRYLKNGHRFSRPRAMNCPLKKSSILFLDAVEGGGWRNTFEMSAKMKFPSPLNVMERDFGAMARCHGTSFLPVQRKETFMLRYVISSALVLCLGFVVALAAEDKKNDEQKATITKVDTKNKELTVKMKDKDGKDVEKTFKLTEDIRYLDSTGKAAVIDIFTSGNEVLVIEKEGVLKQMRKPAAKDDKKDK
jgi:hypothetical protein